jgi:hypothetical protein
METDRERLAQVEVRVEEQGGRLIDLSQQMRDFERKVDTKFTALDAKMTNQFKWLVGINVTMWATMVAAILVVAGLVLSHP